LREKGSEPSKRAKRTEGFGGVIIGAISDKYMLKPDSFLLIKLKNEPA